MRIGDEYFPDKYNARGSRNEEREHWPQWSEKATERVADKFNILMFDGWLSEMPCEDVVTWSLNQIIEGFKAAGKEHPNFSVFVVRNSIGRFQVRVGPIQ